MDISAIARLRFRYEDQEYGFDFPHAMEGRTESDVEGAILFQWTDGNFGCDCNRILFIEQYCGIDLVGGNDEIECGDTVELARLEAVYPDGRTVVLAPDVPTIQERLAALDLV